MNKITQTIDWFLLKQQNNFYRRKTIVSSPSIPAELGIGSSMLGRCSPSCKIVVKIVNFLILVVH